MSKANIQRRVIKSISEWSVFKVTIFTYLIFYALGVLFFSIFFLIVFGVIRPSGPNFSGMGAQNLLQLFGINIPGMNLFRGGLTTPTIIIFVLVGLLLSILFAGISVLYTWIFNVILKISGGIELRFIERGENQGITKATIISNVNNEKVEDKGQNQSNEQNAVDGQNQGDEQNQES